MNKYLQGSIVLFMFFLVGVNSNFYAQNKTIKDLLSTYESAKPDTAKFNAAKELFNYWIDSSNYTQADIYASICENIANKSKINRLMASSKNIRGNLLTETGGYSKAIDTYKEAIELFQKEKNIERIAKLKNSVGRIYFLIEKNEQALKYFNESYQLEKDSLKKEDCLLNIGVAHAALQEYDKAEKCFLEVKLAYERRKDSMGYAYVVNNIGLLNIEQGKFEKGLQNLEIAYKIKMKSGTISQKLSGNYTLADYYLNRKNFSKSKLYIDTQTSLIDTSNKNFELFQNYDLKFRYYEGVKNYELGMKYLKLTIDLKTKLYDEERLLEISKEDAKKEFNQKIMADSIKNESINQINSLKIAEQNAKLNQEKILRYALIFGVLLLGIMGYFIFKRFKESKQKNAIIEAQNNELAKKNKETEDSLIYASRLQNGILPKIQELKKDFKDAFILYQPKDIVSGDFYWTYKSGNFIYIAVGDCTGHGVPGAMMSFLSFNNLERCVKELKLNSTAQILEKLSELIEQSFGFEEKAIRDGLDISLVKIDLDTKELTFSGANNNLYLIQNNKIQKIKATRRSIGYSEFKHPFLEMAFTLHTNDQLFLITDGYADQIGGVNNKKFLTKNLEALLYSVKDNDALMQKKLISEALKDWMQTEEQIDDITILSLEIL